MEKKVITNMKDKLNMLSRSNVVYQFSCPGCESSYIGKTDRTLFERTKEHVTRANVKNQFSINNLIPNDVNTHKFRLNLVLQNTRITDESHNWNVLLFKEAYHFKEKCPVLNTGVKASRKMHQL